MAISEKRIIPLSIEKCEAFKPKREKEKEKLQIDLNLIDEDEIAFKSNDIAGRKSSADSTSVSKPEDISELSCPNTPVSIPKESQQNGMLFGRDRNCSNPVFNFYQITEEHLRETLPEYQNYKKTKNYLPKSEYLKNNESFTESRRSSHSSLNSLDNFTQNNSSMKSSLQTTSVAAVFTPKLCSGGKGKFDLPMYYFGFYGWDSTNGMPMIAFNPKDINQKNEKNSSSSAETSSEDSSQKEKKNENGNKQEVMEPTMMIGTPIFFSGVPKYCYNKMYKKKQKPFTEREGDWICNSCKNLNFAFRVECNRCKLPKGADSKTHCNEEKNNNKESSQEKKSYQRTQRYHKHKKINNYYSNKSNRNESGKE